MSDPKMKEMRDFEWKETEGVFQGTNDLDFENMLQEELSQLSPTDEMTRAINPWRKAMTRILIGMALNMVTIPFFCLQYILPAIGLVMMMLGFRMLRKENWWFSAGWVLTLIHMCAVFPSYVINATIWYGEWIASPLALRLSYAIIVLEGMLLLCLWQGIRTVQKKAEMPPRAGNGLALLIWYMLVVMLAVLEVGGWLVSLVLLTVYALILFSLYRLSYELDEAGYAVRAASVCISDRSLVVGITVVMAVGLTIGYQYFGKYPMEWMPVESAVQKDVAEVKTYLLELGFPNMVLQDLTEEDILACRDAQSVLYGQEIEAFMEKRFVPNRVDRSVYITVVAVQLPGDGQQFRIFHHFLWPDEYGFMGSDRLALHPAYSQDEEWMQMSACTGQVLYAEGENIYAAPFYRIEEKQYSGMDWFGEVQNGENVYAVFSFPEEASRCRGYLTYEVTALTEEWSILAATYYYHQAEWFQYPAQSKMERSFSRFDTYYRQVEKTAQ